VDPSRDLTIPSLISRGELQMRKHKHPSADRNGDGTEPRPPVGFDESIDESTDQQDGSEVEGFARFLRQLRELIEYTSYYLATQADGVKVGLRNVLINVALAALAFLVLASLSVGALWFGLNGMAEGLALLCGDRPWAGNLLTGSLVAAGLAGGVCVILNRFKKLALAETVAKYENRQSRQQARYGHNVAERAAADPSHDQ
jgi:hypothetical protein